MARINPILISSVFRDFQEISQVCDEMLDCFKNYENLPSACKERYKTIEDVRGEILKMHSGTDKYLMVLENVVDKLYAIINLSVFYLENYVSSRNIHRSKSISLGFITNLFWKRLQKRERYNVSTLPSSRTSISSYINLSQILEENKQCEVCNFTVDKLKVIMKYLEKCSGEMSLKSFIAQNREVIKKNMEEIHQKDAIELCFKAMLEDIGVYCSAHLLAREEIKTLRSKVKKLEEETNKVERNYRKLGKNYDELLKHKEELMKTLEEMQKNELELVAANKVISSKLENSGRLHAKNLEDFNEKILEINNKNEIEVQDLKNANNKEVDRLVYQKDYLSRIFEINEETINQLINIIFNQRFHSADSDSDLLNVFEMYVQNVRNDMIEITEINNALKEDVQVVFSNLDRYERKCEDLQETINKSANNEVIKDGTKPNEKKNPLTDMEEQIQANEDKIKHLQDQNERLKITVNKIKAMQFISKAKKTSVNTTWKTYLLNSNILNSWVYYLIKKSV